MGSEMCIRDRYYIQFTAKIPLCKGPWGNFSLVFSRVKKLSKVLCSFDTVFLFKYDFFRKYNKVSFISLGQAPLCTVSPSLPWQ